MKKQLLSLAVGSLVIGLSNAAVFNINLSATQSEILSNDGTPYSGILRVGLHSNPDGISASSTLTDALTGFIELGNATTNFPGFRSSTTIVADDTGNAAPPNNVGQLFMVIGDADDNFGVFTNPAWVLGTFTDPPTPPNQVSTSLTPDSTSVGGVAQFIDGGSVTQPGLGAWQLAGVPEPSVAILAVLGMFGLIRRRR